MRPQSAIVGVATPARQRSATVAAATLLLILAPAPSAGLAATKYCGVVDSFGPSDVVLTGGGTCKTARSIAKATARLPSVGNSPASPKGWKCARITGQPPTGLACTRGSSTINWYSAPSGPASKSYSCLNNTVYANTGVGRVTTRGVPCAIAINVIVLWDSRLPATNGPVGYGCRREVVGAGEPGALTRYTCRRGARRMKFAVGG